MNDKFSILLGHVKDIEYLDLKKIIFIMLADKTIPYKIALC